MNVNKNIEKLFSNRLFTHCLFWSSYVIFYSTLWGSYHDDYGKQFSMQVINLPVRMLLTYFTMYFLLPKFLFPGKWVSFVLTLLLSALVAGIMQRFVTFYIEYPLYYPEYLNTNVFYPYKILKGLVGIYPVVFLAMAIKLLKYWYINQKDKQTLVNEKLESELKFLKTQIHPHFLFNTLNNLYALTLKKSDKAPATVLKLSDLINYMLYECNADTVPLDKEIDFVKNYIEIEKMRHGENLDVQVNIMGKTKPVNIAPMIILPFLENSFKHGVNEELESSKVLVELEITDNSLILKVENSKSDTQNLIQNGSGTGIGLKNVKRRLDLLYPEMYELNITDEDDLHRVMLKITRI